MKWRVNKCDVVIFLEHESVIPRECGIQIVWDKTVWYLTIIAQSNEMVGEEYDILTVSKHESVIPRK